MEEVNALEVGEKKRSFLASGDIKIPKETYHIFGFWITYLCTVIFIVVAIGFLCFGIYELAKDGSTSIHNFLVPIVLILISCIITYFFPFYSSITVDLTNKQVICRKFKLFFIIKNIVTIETQNIAKVYTERNESEGYGDKESTIDAFNLVFEMNNGEKIIGLEGEVNKNFEMIKVGYFMSKFFPGIDLGGKPESILETEEK